MSGWAGLWIGLGLLLLGQGLLSAADVLGRHIADGLRRFSTGARQ